ncbi:FAD-binding oxidoreductase [Anthocerotibacter panamensis]|uniref:FAD-binding oxidoreductase n=1 Tax=Anthocerotibacter panamensis TaxID=2857077 RepID=UPI001C406A83|nr:FAD-binding oxidoreductase [Anthocerotibacter panamensis]
MTHGIATISRELAGIADIQAMLTPAQLAVDERERLMSSLAPGANLGYVIYPTTQEALAGVMACAHRQGWRVLPFGRGSKLGWGGLTGDIEIAVSTQYLDRMVDHASGDLTVTVEAGVRFSQLQEVLGRAGQFLALDPAFPERATLGGILATADTGGLRQRYGGVRDLCLGITVVRADGQRVKAGGRVVKNVAGYDLMKLFTGSYGSLGVVTQATFRLNPLPAAADTVLLSGELGALTQATLTLLNSALTPTIVDLLTPQLAERLSLGTQAILAVRFQGLAAAVHEQRTRLHQVAAALRLEVLRTPESEADFWTGLGASLWSLATGAVVCKTGVPTSAIANLITELEQVTQKQGFPVLGVFHAGSGLGTICLEPHDQPLPEVIQALGTLRFYSQEQGGFLTVLEAPQALKTQWDVWGYSGNALPWMRQIKQQFDPEQRLSPNRFVGGSL